MFRDTRLIRLHASSLPDLLVCFPHAGAGVSAFMNWPRKFCELLSVALIQLPGREDRMQETFSQTLSEASIQIAEELASENIRTVFLFGHSMGASIAWAVAGQLWRSWGIRPVVILSAQSPHILLRDPNQGHDGMREWFKLLGDGFPLALENDELLDIFQSTFFADLAWMKRELAVPQVGKLPIDLHCVHALRDGLVSREGAAQWQRYTSARFSMIPMQGGHLYFLNDSEELLNFIYRLIEDYTRHADSSSIK